MQPAVGGMVLRPLAARSEVESGCGGNEEVTGALGREERREGEGCVRIPLVHGQGERLVRRRARERLPERLAFLAETRLVEADLADAVARPQLGGHGPVATERDAFDPLE